MTRNSGISSNFKGPIRKGVAGFTLFEVMLALAIFMIAVTGIAIAIDTALKAALEVRQRSLCRTELESRLALCQADPPGETPRILEAKENHGVRVEEALVPYYTKDAKGRDVQGLHKLTITTTSGTQRDRAEILLYRP